jgi:integrase
MPKKPRSRIYSRGGRLWGDFRDYSDQGGKQEPLRPKGEKLATTDPDIAAQLVTDRIKDLEKRRRNKSLLGIERQASLAEYAATHLVEKARSGRVTEAWLEQAENHLEAAVRYFGQGRDLASISALDMQAYANWLAKQPNRRGGVLGSGTRRQYLNSLSNLYRRAAGEGYVPPGFNPVGSLMDKPAPVRKEARWLEVHEAALLLESARTYTPQKAYMAVPFIYPLLATFLLTGGRESEVTGLEVEDVSFDRRTVTFRPHAHRRLKTSSSFRVVPLWPQLEEILRAYVFGSAAPPGRLLFPATRGKEQPVQDFRKILDAVAGRAGWKEREVRSRQFRHTYASARLQTLDQGHPVSLYTVQRELGHGSDRLLKEVYAHLGTVRHRSDVVEYRVEQHRQALGERLEALQAAP